MHTRPPSHLHLPFSYTPPPARPSKFYRVVFSVFQITEDGDRRAEAQAQGGLETNRPTLGLSPPSSPPTLEFPHTRRLGSVCFLYITASWEGRETVRTPRATSARPSHTSHMSIRTAKRARNSPYPHPHTPPTPHQSGLAKSWLEVTCPMPTMSPARPRPIRPAASRRRSKKGLRTAARPTRPSGR